MPVISGVGKLETFSMDHDVILHQMNVEDIASFKNMSFQLRKPSEKSNTTAQSYETYWKSIDNDSVQKLRQIYSIDLTMFDYPQWP